MVFIVQKPFYSIPFHSLPSFLLSISTLFPTHTSFHSRSFFLIQTNTQEYTHYTASFLSAFASAAFTSMGRFLAL